MCNTYGRISVLSKTIFIGALSIASLAFIDSKEHTLIIVATFFVIGFASCGPDSVLIGAVTMEVGGEIHGARVTSLVNGIGTAVSLCITYFVIKVYVCNYIITHHSRED